MLTISARTLAGHLDALRLVVARREAIPALAHVLIEPLDGALRLSATDLDVSLVMEATGDYKADDALCLPLDRLHTLLKALGDTEITLTRQPNFWVTVKCARGTYKLTGMEPSGFAAISTVEAQPYECSPADFLAGLNATRYFMADYEHSAGDTRCVHFEVNGSLRFVTLHGTRGALACCDVTSEQPFLSADDPLVMFDIPRKTVLALLKMVDANGSPLAFWSNDNLLVFRQGEWTLTARRLADVRKFPDYRPILGEWSEAEVKVDMPALAAAMELMVSFGETEDRTNLKHVDVSVTSGTLSLSVTLRSGEQAHETLPCEFEGEIDWPYSANLVRDALVAAPTTRLAFVGKGTQGWMKLTSETGNVKLVQGIWGRVK